MKIGLDFDNTIVSYDNLFHKVALEKKLIPAEFPINKVLIRDFLIRENKGLVWTEMQGYVYGARMNEAQPYPGLIEALSTLKMQGHILLIISHKTKFPYVGAKYDLHAASENWIKKKLQYEECQIINRFDVNFCDTKEKKIKKIDQLGCDIFLDDLPEILFSKEFPDKTKRCLFDPEGNFIHLKNKNLSHHANWQSFANWVSNEMLKHDGK